MHNDNEKTPYERHVRAYLAATRRLVDPGRNAMTETSPYAMTGGDAFDMGQLIRHGAAANELDADLIHLVFAPSQTVDGPINVMAACARGPNVIIIRQECRFWLDPRGRPALICRQGDRYATMTFDPDGMDSMPGKPKGSLERGYARATATLRRYAAEALAADLPMAA